MFEVELEIRQDSKKEMRQKYAQQREYNRPEIGELGVLLGEYNPSQQ